MLKSFTVDNFKTFDRPVTIDFSATGGYDFNCEAVKDGIVKTAVMYGKNASGKSSLALALLDIVSCLTDNYACPEKYGSYINFNTGRDGATFCYIFRFGEHDVKYRYRKLIRFQSAIVAEELVIDGKTVVAYDRDMSNTDILMDVKGTDTLLCDLPAMKISVLKYIRGNAVLPKSVDAQMFDALFDFVNGMLMFWYLDDRSYVGYVHASRNDMVSGIVRSGHFDDMCNFFMDAGITDELQYDAKSEQLFVRYKSGVKVNFFDVASDGMSALLLLFYWLNALDVGDAGRPLSFVCIDEFDAFYHFELSRFVVKMLKSLDVQSLVTTHNTSLLSNEILRPDCYYICSKEQITNLNHATDKQLRQVHNIENLYRGGTFGL